MTAREPPVPAAASADPAALRAALAEHPKVRARDLAAQLGLPEAALVAAQVGHGAVRIAAAPDRLIPAVAALGEVMALTRNAACVHERIGRYRDIRPGTGTARVRGPGIDLRLVPRHWVHAFAVLGERPSLQVFDAAGDAVHKVHLRAASDRSAFERLIALLALPDQSDALPTLARRAAPPPEPAAGGPRRAPGMGGSAPRAPAAVRRLLQPDATAAAPGAPAAVPLAPRAMVDLLTGAARAGLMLRIAVGNPGCLQLHRGPVVTLVPMGPWFNVMDPHFNLHLRTDQVAAVWRRERPARPGPAPSVAACDATGRPILEVSAGAPADRAAWEALLAALPAADGSDPGSPADGRGETG